MEYVASPSNKRDFGLEHDTRDARLPVDRQPTREDSASDRRPVLGFEENGIAADQVLDRLGEFDSDIGPDINTCRSFLRCTGQDKRRAFERRPEVGIPKRDKLI